MDFIRRNSTFFTVLGIAVVCGLSAGLTLHAARHAGVIEALVARAGAAGPLVMVGLYGLLGASPVPSEPLTVMGGAVFGPLLGTMIAGVGNTLAAVVEYYIGASMGEASDFAEKRKSLPFGLGRLPADSVWFLLGGRLIPGYGAKVVSVIGGVYRVPLWRYIWTTAIPTFAGAALFAYGGASLLKLF